MDQNDLPLVSCIVPVYNVEAYIDDCLQSILNQTYKNIEIILINDKSTDSSLRKISKYPDYRLKILNNDTNRGLAFTRNVGLAEAKGEYIVFIDSDDYINDEFIESLLNKIQTTQSDIAIAKTILVPDLVPLKLQLSMNQMATFCEKINIVPNGSCWNKMYKKKLLEQHDIKFPEGLYWEDNPFTILTLFYSKKICISDEAIYFYRQRKNSISKNTTNIIKKKRDSLSVIDILLSYFLYIDITNDDIKALFSTFNWFIPPDAYKDINFVRSINYKKINFIKLKNIDEKYFYKQKSLKTMKFLILSKLPFRSIRNKYLCKLEKNLFF